MKTLAIVPARGGSKGIPRKNIRYLGEHPLVSHVIKTCRSSSEIDETVLTTDSTEIAAIGRKYGVDEVINRPKELATDQVPLAPVVRHAYEEYLKHAEHPPDAVVTVQPTAPLIAAESLNEGIKRIGQNNHDSVIFVTDSTHLYWKKSPDGMEPILEDRKNRQQLESIYEEVGIFVSDPSLIVDNRRVGNTPAFYEVPMTEGVDIDTYSDWLVAETELEKCHVVYRMTGNAETGLGHVYRGLTVVDRVFKHDVEFVVEPHDDVAIEMLEESNYPYKIFEDEEAFTGWVQQIEPDVVVNDVLDTTREYIKALKASGARVVNMEDLGDGAEEADAVINALYEYTDPPSNHYYGHRYFCLRNEFVYAERKQSIDTVERIMVSFGGTDEGNLSVKTVNAIGGLSGAYEIDIVIGPGYQYRSELEEALQELPDRFTAEVEQDVSSMADHLERADLLVTSNGRTVYEGASVNLPMISIAQNQHEQRHPYAHISQGILFLGQASYIDEPAIRSAISDYIEDDDLRESMRRSLAADDIRNGLDRVLDIIFEEL